MPAEHVGKLVIQPSVELGSLPTERVAVEEDGEPRTPGVVGGTFCVEPLTSEPYPINADE